MKRKIKEGDYRSAILDPYLRKLEYPVENLDYCRRGVDFKIYDRKRFADYIFYYNDKPILDIEAKASEKDFDVAVSQAHAYGKNFNPDGSAIPFVMAAAGKKIVMFQAKPLEMGGVRYEPLPEVLPWKELINIVEKALKPKKIKDITSTIIGLENIVSFFTNISGILHNQRRPKLNSDRIIIAMNDLLWMWVKNRRRGRIYKKYSISKKSRSEIEPLLKQYDAQTIKGNNLAYAYRQFLARYFRGESIEMTKEKRESSVKLGRYLTPTPVIDFMIKLSNPDRKDKIIDFACGSGGFLGGIIKLIKRNKEKFLKSNLYGIDIDPFSVSSAKTFLFLLLSGKFEDFNIYQTNALLENENIKDGSFDLVISNPPGNDRYVLGNIKAIKQRFSLIKNKMLLNPFLFITQAVYLTKNNGRICLIVPDGVFANKNYEDLRDFIFSNMQVKAIISLPRNIFPNVSSKMSILYAIKTKSPDKNKPIFMAKISEDADLGIELQGILEKYEG